LNRFLVSLKLEVECARIVGYFKLSVTPKGLFCLVKRWKNKSWWG